MELIASLPGHCCLLKFVSDYRSDSLLTSEEQNPQTTCIQHQHTTMHYNSSKVQHASQKKSCWLSMPVLAKKRHAESAFRDYGGPPKVIGGDAEELGHS